MKYLNRNGENGDEDDPLSAKIIGIAINVHRELGSGFLESIYLPVISEVQVINYLKAAGLPVGLILNFGISPLQIKRKYRNRPARDLDLRLHEV
jgi:hypothetical protein